MSSVSTSSHSRRLRCGLGRACNRANHGAAKVTAPVVITQFLICSDCGMTFCSAQCKGAHTCDPALGVTPQELLDGCAPSKRPRLRYALWAAMGQEPAAAAACGEMPIVPPTPPMLALHRMKADLAACGLTASAADAFEAAVVALPGQRLPPVLQLASPAQYAAVMAAVAAPPCIREATVVFMVQGVEQPAWFDASGPRCAPPNQAAILSATLKVHGYVALFVDSSRLQWGVADPTCLSPERAVVAAVVPGSFVQRLAPADVLVARQRMSQRIALAGIASARGAGLNTTPTMMTGFNNSSQRGKTEAAIGRVSTKPAPVSAQQEAPLPPGVPRQPPVASRLELERLSDACVYLDWRVLAAAFPGLSDLQRCLVDALHSSAPKMKGSPVNCAGWTINCVLPPHPDTRDAAAPIKALIGWTDPGGKGMQDRPFVLYSLHAALDPVEPDSLVLLESAEVVHGTADCMQEPARQAEVFRVAHASQLAKEVITAGSRLMDTVREVAAAGSTHAALAGASQRIWDRMLRNAQHNSMAGWNVFEDEADFSALLASEGVTSRGWMTAAAGKLGGLRLDSSLRKALTTGDQSNQ